MTTREAAARYEAEHVAHWGGRPCAVWNPKTDRSMNSQRSSGLTTAGLRDSWRRFFLPKTEPISAATLAPLNATCLPILE